MRLFLLGLFIFATFSSVYAQTNSDEFNIRIFGGSDIEAPTTPTLLTVNPVSTSQIDVTWSVATDNFAVAGYVLYRDGSPIATTTLTNYSDTGLLASTTYQYGVQAFDISDNYSSTSNLLSTTTLDLPPPPPPSTGGQADSSTASRVVLDDLIIKAGVSTTSFSIKTVHPARFEMRWGRTINYELGSVVTNRFIDFYQTTLTDLEPGTTYQYEIVGYTPFGQPTILKNGSFTTLSLDQFFPPANVNRFTAVAQDSDVNLSWQSSNITDFAFVRIVRSHLGFPRHPQDGAVIYQGTQESFLDKDILNEFSPVYYTAFVYNSAGAVSSGAVARVYAAASGDTGLATSSSDRDTPSIIDDEPTIIIKDPSVLMPQVSDILIKQLSSTYSFLDPRLDLNSQESFLISISKEAVADSLKSIIVTLTDPTDSRREYSFLLRLNKEGTAYEAVIAPLNLVGTSRLIIEIYNFEAMVVGTYAKAIHFSEPQLGVEAKGNYLGEFITVVSLALLPLLLILLWWLFYFKRDNEDKE